MPTTKITTSMHHPQRRNVTTSMVGLKWSHMRKSHPKRSTPEIWQGNQRKKNELVIRGQFVCNVCVPGSVKMYLISQCTFYSPISCYLPFVLLPLENRLVMFQCCLKLFLFVFFTFCIYLVNNDLLPSCQPLNFHHGYNFYCKVFKDFLLLLFI